MTGALQSTNPSALPGAPPAAFIDGHAHLRLEAAARDALLANMDRLGIDRTVVVGGGLASPLQISTHIATGSFSRNGFDNKQLLDLIAEHRERLLPFYFANPWAEPEAGPSEYAELGSRFWGLKLGPAVHGVGLNDKRNIAYVRVAARLGHPVYLHCLDRQDLRVRDLTALAEKFPGVQFILGHGGISHMDYHAVELIHPFPNIHFETSGASTAVIRYAIGTLGPGRVIFGSEHPLQDVRVELRKAECLELEPQAFRSYTCTNMLKLLLGRVPQ